jgi:hypothetical protein
MRLVLAVFLMSAALSAAAETCKYIDKEGRVIYSNVPLKTAKKVQCFEPPPVPVAPPARAAAPARPAASAATGAPKVDAQTQRTRDLDRRRILQEELADEEGKLSEARKALLEQESIRTGDERNYQKVLDRLKPYQEAVDLHERNIASIKQELANLR